MFLLPKIDNFISTNTFCFIHQIIFTIHKIQPNKIFHCGVRNVVWNLNLTARGLKSIQSVLIMLYLRVWKFQVEGIGVVIYSYIRNAANKWTWRTPQYIDVVNCWRFGARKSTVRFGNDVGTVHANNLNVPVFLYSDSWLIGG
jgi:hypothetical protein